MAALADSLIAPPCGSRIVGGEQAGANGRLPQQFGAGALRSASGQQLRLGSPASARH
jgi:hypothetical protein